MLNVSASEQARERRILSRGRAPRLLLLRPFRVRFVLGAGPGHDAVEAVVPFVAGVLEQQRVRFPQGHSDAPGARVRGRIRRP